MHKRKETERVDKWMAMMSVKKRDQGGNIAEWGWRKDAQGQKVRRVGSDVGQASELTPPRCLASETDIQRHPRQMADGSVVDLGRRQNEGVEG